jgi:hypothetical protein
MFRVGYVLRGVGPNPDRYIEVRRFNTLNDAVLFARRWDNRRKKRDWMDSSIRRTAVWCRNNGCLYEYGNWRVMESIEGRMGYRRSATW